MKFHRFLLLALLPITAMFAACNHDEGETMLELHVERFGGQKLAVQDSTGAWSEGDSVWINGQNYRISIDNNGHAVVSVPTAPSYNAVFPASIKRDGNKVCLPAEYHYTTEGGRQVLNLPMVASSDGSNGLFFNHLTGALIVKFSNDRSETVVVDRITVHCAHPLCGTFEISDTTLSPSGATDTSITMYFDRQEVLLANHNTIAVMLPIVPVNGAQFTVKVSCHVNGDRYSDSTRQANQHDFERNRLGYAFMKVEAGNSPGYLFEFTGQDLLIKTAQDFVLMQQAINNGWSNSSYRYSNMSYMIDTNIDMAGYEIEPITGFTGQRFNGGGHIVSNLTIKSNTAYCALFDNIPAGTTISDITLTGVNLISGGTGTTRYISPFIGRLTSKQTFNNCITNVAHITIEGNTSGGIFFGGIAAQITTYTKLYNCNFSGSGNISSNSNINWGGFVGAIDNSNTRSLNVTYCTIPYCQFRLNANNGIYAGGIIGDNKKSHDTIAHSTLNINLTTNNTTGYIRAGGLIGNISNSTITFRVEDINITGEISVESGSSTNIGTIYGRGRPPYQYPLLISYNITDFSIPDKDNHNPGGYYY